MLIFADTMYTERYMDTPQANPEGYERADVIQQAEALRGRQYLLAHGTDDDNVHFQHSMLLAKQLQHKDIDFEQMVSIIGLTEACIIFGLTVGTQQ